MSKINSKSWSQFKKICIKAPTLFYQSITWYSLLPSKISFHQILIPSLVPHGYVLPPSNEHNFPVTRTSISDHDHVQNYPKLGQILLSVTSLSLGESTGFLQYLLKFVSHCNGYIELTQDWFSLNLCLFSKLFI